MFTLIAWLLSAPTTTPPPVTFTAEQCRYGQAMRIASCKGKVRVRRGDAHLRCKELTVNFDVKGAIERLSCVGAVQFTRGEEEATGQRADYERDRGRVTLKGQAQLKRGLAKLAGERVIFLLDKDEVMVEGGAQGQWQETNP